MADPNYYIVFDTSSNLPVAKYFESIRNIRLSDGQVLLQSSRTESMSDVGPLLNKVNDPGRPLALAKEMKKTEISDMRLALERDGIQYVFPDGPGVIQTRDEIDFRNINGLVSMALILKGAGDTTTKIGFRDMFNGTHMLNSDEIIQMGAYVNQSVSTLYGKSWAKKAQVDALTTIEEVNSYDVQNGW